MIHPEQDGGSCTYAAAGFDCDGNCLSGCDELQLTCSIHMETDGMDAVNTINGVDYTMLILVHQLQHVLIYQHVIQFLDCRCMGLVKWTSWTLLEISQHV